MTSGIAQTSGIPLRDSGWLSAGYTLFQTDLENWLGQLCRALQPLHANSRLYGAMSPNHVMLDPQGRLHLDAGRAASMDGRALPEGLHDLVNPGFAAFEQYVDDPAWPLGPWTDIYGVSALARSLILKQSPPDAVQRMVSDTCEPLQGMNLPAYTPRFLHAIDQGMSLQGQQRFASIDEFAQALGLPLEPAAGKQDMPDVVVAPAPEPLPQAAVSAPAPVPEPVKGPVQEPVQASAQVPAGERVPDQTRNKAPIWMMAFVVIALIAAGAYLLREQGTDSQEVAAPQVAQAVDAPEPAAAPEPAPSSQMVLKPEPVFTAASESEPVAMAEAGPETPQTAPLESMPIEELDMQAHMQARALLAATGLETQEPQPVPETALQDDAALAEVMQAEDEPADVDSAADETEQTATTTAAAPAAQAPDPGIRIGLSIRPWGEVFVNGASQGVSPPLRALSLKPGEYRVRVINGELPPHEQTLTVRAGESASIAHDFEADE